MTDNEALGENTVELETYVAIVRRHKRLVIASTLTCLIVAAIATFLATPTYTAESRVVVKPIEDPVEGTTEEVIIETERGVASSLRVATIAGELMESDADPSALLSGLSVEPVTDAQILKFVYTSTDAEQAYQAADAFARAYLRFRTEEASEAASTLRGSLEQQDEELSQEIADLEARLAALPPGSPERASLQVDLRVVQTDQTTLRREIADLDAETADPGTIIDEAEVPSSPTSPDLKLNLAAALLLGLIGGIGGAFVLERFRRPRSASETAGVPDPEQAYPFVERRKGDRRQAQVSLGDDRRAALPPPDERPALGNGANGEVLPVRAQPPPTPPPPPEPPAPVGVPVPEAPVSGNGAEGPLAALGVRLLGTAPRGSGPDQPPLPEVAPPGSDASRAFAQLHISIRALLGDRRVVVVAANENPGLASGAAANLAAAAANDEESVLLLDADLRGPLVHERLDLINHQGLAEILRGERPAEQVMQGWGGLESLCIVTAGDAQDDAHSLLSPTHLSARLAALRDDFDLVIVAGPPITASAEGPDVCAIADGVLFVMDAADRRSTELEPAVAVVEQTGADVLGAFLIEPAGWESVGALADRVGTPADR